MWKIGHYARDCQEKSYGNKISLINHTIRTGKINGKQATRIHLNIGSSTTLIHWKFVPVSVNTGCFVEMRNTTGTQRYPIAVAEIERDAYCYNQEVAVLKQLEEDFLLGMDVILWSHLFEAMEPDVEVQMKKLAEAKEKPYTVTTQAQAKKLETQQSPSHSGGTDPEFSLKQQFCFDDSLFGCSRKDREH